MKTDIDKNIKIDEDVKKEKNIKMDKNMQAENIHKNVDEITINDFKGGMLFIYCNQIYIHFIPDII